jgi:hypothetical protein
MTVYRFELGQKRASALQDCIEAFCLAVQHCRH